MHNLYSCNYSLALLYCVAVIIVVVVVVAYTTMYIHNNNRMSVMLESAVQARAATEQQPIAASGNLATAFKAVHTRITGTCKFV
jgi:hypothetical protein